MKNNTGLWLIAGVAVGGIAWYYYRTSQGLPVVPATVSNLFTSNTSTAATPSGGNGSAGIVGTAENGLAPVLSGNDPLSGLFGGSLGTSNNTDTPEGTDDDNSADGNDD
jgi:hypothetical protein